MTRGSRMPFHSHDLPNGLRLIGETSPSARSVALGFFVRTGSRDESADVSGVSHFLEHMMFKGTPRRTALDVNLDFDRIGASYNAGVLKLELKKKAEAQPKQIKINVGDKAKAELAGER